jgi:ribonuclease P protein component
VLFSKSRRLLKKKEFRKVFDLGHKRVFDGFILFRCAHEAPSRVGLVVSRKVGGAVVRNKVKRRLREIFRQFILPYAKGDWVVVARKGSYDLSFGDLQKSLTRAMQRWEGV